jgi:hypothetical protein
MAYTPIYTPKNFTDWGPPDLDASNLNDIEAALVSLGNGLQTAAADTDANTAAITTINGEISDLNDLIDEILPDDSASGNPAVITDAFAGECKSLILTLEPIQSGSGTPSPANPRPITGRTQSTATRSGKNFYSKTPFFVRSGCTQSNYGVAKSDVTFTAASGFFGNSSQGTLSDQNPDKMVTVEAGKEYTVSLHLLSSAPAGLELKCYIQFFDKFGKNATSWQISTGASYTFTVPAGKSKVAFNCIFSNATVNTTVTIGFQIEAGDTATDWEAYNGESITRTYGQTVYGGSDDVMGEGATSTKKLNEINGGFSAAASGAFYKDGITDISDIPSLCNIYPIGAEVNSAGGANDYPKTLCWQKNGLQSLRLCVYDSDFADVAAFNAALTQTPMQVIFDLATPTSIPLTAQNITLLHGDNVITTDADNVEVDYKADIALYIAKQLGGNLGNRGAKSAPAEEPAADTKEEEKNDDKIIEPVTKEAKK